MKTCGSADLPFQVKLEIMDVTVQQTLKVLDSRHAQQHIHILHLLCSVLHMYGHGLNVWVAHIHEQRLAPLRLCGILHCQRPACSEEVMQFSDMLQVYGLKLQLEME